MLHTTDTLTREIKEIFLSSQETTAIHQKNCMQLKKLYEATPSDEFFTCFKHLINVILQTDFTQRNIYVEKIVEFVASFCFVLKSAYLKNKSNEVEDDEDLGDHPFLQILFGYLLEASQNILDVVRFRSCQMINKLLDTLQGASIDVDFCENLKNVLLLRLNDPKSVIRLQAIISLFRLQDPSNPNDEISNSFVDLMALNPQPKVRQLCVEKIQLNKKVIPHIVMRTRDTDPNVRLAAYKRLSALPKGLKIVEKQEILKCGIIYAAPKVNDYVSKTFLECWLEHYDNNILTLMKFLRLDTDDKDIEDSTKTIEFVLENIFKLKTFKELLDVLLLDQNKLVPLEHLNWETVVFWRVFLEYLIKHDELENNLDQVLPELQDLCQYIKNVVPSFTIKNEQFMEQQFILRNLFIIIKTYDFEDPSRKRHVNSLITHVLENVDLMPSTIKEIIDTLAFTIRDIKKRCVFVGEIISEIMYPMDVEEATRIQQEKEFELAKLKVKQNCLIEQLETAIAEQRFIEADSLKKELAAAKCAITDLINAPSAHQPKQKTDSSTFMKCLGIARGLLLSPQVTELFPFLKTLQKDFIEDLVGHNNDIVKAMAMECYALCCIVDKKSAEIGIQIFSTPILAYKAGEECDTRTLIVCTRAVVDLLRIFGTDLIAEPDENSLSESRHEGHKEVFTGGTSVTDIIQGLIDLMDDEQYQLQEVSGQGLCKLVINKRIYCAALISKLILKWGSPYSDDQERDTLKQFIGYSLQQIPLLSDSSEQLEDAILLTINSIIKAPKTSPLADINLDNIVKFMVALCKISVDEDQIYRNLARKICLKMKGKPRSIVNPTYSKLLLLLDVRYDTSLFRDLLKLCDQIKDNVRDRTVTTNVTKFVANLTLKKKVSETHNKSLSVSSIKEEREHEITEYNTSSVIAEEVGDNLSNVSSISKNSGRSRKRLYSSKASTINTVEEESDDSVFSEASLFDNLSDTASVTTISSNNSSKFENGRKTVIKSVDVSSSSLPKPIFCHSPPKKEKISSKSRSSKAKDISPVLPKTSTPKNVSPEDTTATNEVISIKQIDSLKGKKTTDVVEEPTSTAKKPEEKESSDD